MNGIQRLLPHPITSIMLAVCWLLLQHSVSPGHLLLGGLMGILVPLFTRRFWPEHVHTGRPLTALRFTGIVLLDILVANFSVARLSMSPLSALRPGFVRLPVELDSDFAVTILASTVSLTPGTVAAELSADRAHLIIHYLDCDDEAALVRSVKERYEAPLKEIFAC